MFEVTVVMTAYYTTYCDSSHDYGYLNFLSTSNFPKVTNFGAHIIFQKSSNGKRE